MNHKKVAVVTGASRGIGKGVALAFGAAGATVYVTGRSSRGGEMLLPGTIEETAEEINAAGGHGIAVNCDHAVDGQVRALFEQVDREAGKLDILVNNAAKLPAALVGQGGFWERSLELADMYNVGLRSAYVASCLAAPLMVRQRRGLIASISFYGSVSYFAGPAYGSQKAALDKMMHDMAADLKPHNVAALSVWPGMVRTETNVQRWAGKPGAEEKLAQYETPEFVGMVINAMFEDKTLMSFSGRTVIAAEYAAEKGIKDGDGKQPISYREKMGVPPVYFSA